MLNKQFTFHILTKLHYLLKHSYDNNLTQHKKL